MKFLDLWRFWRQKERGTQFSHTSFSSSKSDGDLSTATSGSGSLWSRKRKTLKIKKSKNRQPAKPPPPPPYDGSDSGHVTASPPLRAKFLRKDNFLRHKDRAPRFREAQKFWERKIKSQRPKKCFECRSRCGKMSSRQMCPRCEVVLNNPCRGCHIPITGPIIVIGSFRFHPECFTCSRCFSIIGTDEKYSIISASRLFCETCVCGIISIDDLGRDRANSSSSSSKSTAVTVVTYRSTNEINKLGFTLADSSGQPVANIESDISRESETRENDKILAANGVTVDRSDKKEMVIRMKKPPNDETIKFIVQRNIIFNENSKNPPSPSLSRSETPRSSFKRARRKVVPLSQSSLSDGSDFEDERLLSRNRKTASLQLIPRGTELEDLPGSSRSDGSDSDTGFYLDSRRISGTPLSRAGSIPQRSAAFLSQQTSPILTRNRSLTASQVIRKRFQRKFDDTRRSSVELSSSRRDRTNSIFSRNLFRNIEKQDLSRSESMRLGTITKEGVPSYRVFRPCDLLIGETLGEGFFASAIKVTHRDTHEVMVLKQLHRNTENDAYANFLKEVKVLRSIKHKNVLRFIGVLYKDKKMNLITEFIECGTLKEHIQNSKDFNWCHRIGIARDIAAGMEYLHQSSIIHRDLNSNNCLVKEDGSVVVADFGLARWTRREEEMITDRRETKTRKLKKRTKSKKYNVVGSPFWMAPEMLGGDEYDERIDVFSFGIILCEIIGRVDPDPDYLPRTTGFGLAVAQYYVQFALKFGCPEYYFAIAVRCCEIDPEMRPSFDDLHSWYELLMRRQKLPKLPIPPHVLSVRDSVFEEYRLAGLNSLDDLSEVFEESSVVQTSTTEDSCFSN